MMRYYCTYFDSNYLIKGLALIRSLQQHEPEPFRLFVVCHDELTRVLLGALALPQVVTIPMHELERGDAALLEAKTNRNPVEYFWTTTPTVLLRLLEAHPEIDVLTYLDSDLYFFSSPEPIFQELGSNSVLIHEHRFSPELAYLQQESGRFNVGLMCFRNDYVAASILKRWRDQCNAWCYQQPEEGKMGDQAYLNDWPDLFPEVAVLQHKGAGVAPWNLTQYPLSQDDAGATRVDDVPLVFFHFHALEFVRENIITPAKHLAYRLSEPALRLCYKPYLHALTAAVAEVKETLPAFKAGLNREGIYSLDHTLLVHGAARSDVHAAFPSLRFVDLGGSWSYTASRQAGTDAATEASKAGPAPAVAAAPPQEARRLRVSAIVSAYNSEAFLEGCLEDLVSQTLFSRGELEIIVIDSGSTQNEHAIVDAFQRRYGNILYVRTAERESIYQSWNRGLRLAASEYVTNANADDRHRRDALEKLAACLDEHPSIALVYADSLITSVPNDTFERTQAPLRFDWPAYSYEELEQHCIIGPHPMWRKRLHQQYGYFDERYVSAGDYEFWLRIGKTESFYRYPDTLGLYYYNAGGVQYASGAAVREHHEIIAGYQIPQRGIQPKPTVRAAVRPEEREALKRKAGYAGEARAFSSFSEAVGAFQQFVVAQEWPGAHALAVSAARSFPEESYAWVMLAISCRMTGSIPDALQAVTRSFQVEESPFALHEMMQIATATGNAQEAAEIARHLAHRFPEWLVNAA